MNPVPATAAAPPAFEQPARQSASRRVPAVHRVDAVAAGADPSRHAPRWGA